MPKVHQIGPKLFIQHIDFPVEWGKKWVVRGWTQEIEEPFREAVPLIFRMPSHKALVFGVWKNELTEEEALSKALQTREVTYEDFQEDAGWTPAPDQDREESVDALYARLGSMVGDVDVYNRQTP